MRELEAVSQKAGGDGYLVLRARGGSPETLRRFAHALAPRLEALDEVRYVEFRYDTRFFEERALLLLPAEYIDLPFRQALETILTALPADLPWPVLVAQHMPATFTSAFAQRLDRICALTVTEVRQSTVLRPGQVHIDRKSVV